MGKAARAWVLEHYVDAHVLELTVNFYKRLPEHHGVSTAPIAPGTEDLAIEPAFNDSQVAAR